LASTLSDVRQLKSPASLGILALGGLAAAGAHSVDGDVTRSLSDSSSLRRAMKPGALIGGMPFELGTAFAAYQIGRAFHKPCAAALGADLIQAQLIAETFTLGVKQIGRRSRPEGTGFSFPSGHTATAFASATVLQRHFGWKAGVPAYAVASYVAMSRVQMKRHYLSDVAFGAALGIVAGRTVPAGHDHVLVLTPTAGPSGAGASFTWVRKK